MYFRSILSSITDNFQKWTCYLLTLWKHTHTHTHQTKQPTTITLLLFYCFSCRCHYNPTKHGRQKVGPITDSCVYNESCLMLFMPTCSHFAPMQPKDIAQMTVFDFKHKRFSAYMFSLFLDNWLLGKANCHSWGYSGNPMEMFIGKEN